MCQGNENGSLWRIRRDGEDVLPVAGNCGFCDGFDDAFDTGVTADDGPLTGTRIKAVVVDGMGLAVHDGEDDGISRLGIEVIGGNPGVATPCGNMPAAVGERDLVADTVGGRRDDGSAVPIGIIETDQTIGVNGGGSSL